jgi:hypothetical protein
VDYFQRLEQEEIMKTLFPVCFLFGIPLALLSQQSETDSHIGNPFSQSKYVPDISFILDASFVQRDRTDAEWETLGTPGLMDGSQDGRNGFNLNYGELVVSSAVDPYFNLTGVLTVSEGGMEIEEGFFTARRLPLGFQAKAGKFRSGFGRINEQHEHAWDFVDLPLVFRAFFGEEGLNEKGLQVQWVPPVNMYWMFGAEWFAGENHASFGKDGFEAPDGSILVREKNGNNLVTAYVRTSADVGDAAVLAGLSAAYGGTRYAQGFDEPGGRAIDGNTALWGANLYAKVPFDANRSLAFQAEFLSRRTEGDLYLWDPETGTETVGLLKNQSGYYAQIVAKWAMRWRSGFRFDAMDRNAIWERGVRLALPGSLQRMSASLEFNPTEFSRFRLQYNHDRSRYAGEEGSFSAKTVRECVLQCNLAIGAHGAHAF